MKQTAIERQRAYYAETASKYDEMHLQDPEHEYAIAQLTGLLNHYRFDSLLDVGAGTGRVMRRAQGIKSSIKVRGVEPVQALREIGHAKGIGVDDLTDGDATKLPFADNSWDVVCAFGILHHIPNPNVAIAEMCRVAKHAVFFSDLNNYGCGSFPQRLLAQTLHKLGLWKTFQWVKNGGKMDKYSEGDGVHFSYSLFDSLDVIKQKFPQTFLSNTKGQAKSIYRGCSHMSVFAVKGMEELNALNPHAG